MVKKSKVIIFHKTNLLDHYLFGLNTKLKLKCSFSNFPLFFSRYTEIRNCKTFSQSYHFPPKTLFNYLGNQTEPNPKSKTHLIELEKWTNHPQDAPLKLQYSPQTACQIINKQPLQQSRLKSTSTRNKGHDSLQHLRTGRSRRAEESLNIQDGYPSHYN